MIIGYLIYIEMQKYYFER